MLSLGCFLALFAAPAPSSLKPGISLFLVTPEAPAPKFTKRVIVDPKGNLRSVRSHPITDEDLRDWLHKGGGEPILVEIKASVEDDTSLATYLAVVEKVRKLADPKAETRIYLYFDPLAHPPKR